MEHLSAAEVHVDPPSAAARGEAGFSLVESLIAALLFLVIVVGVLPLFLSAISNNVAGDDYLHASNFARSNLEQFHKLPFSTPTLTIPSGKTTLTTTDYWAQDPRQTDVGQWVATPAAAAPGQQVLWQRTSTVRQYSVDALADGVLTTDEALDGSTDPLSVHLKEVRVQLVGQRNATGLGPGRQLIFRVLKAF